MQQSTKAKVYTDVEAIEFIEKFNNSDGRKHDRY